ncbi:Electron transfer flavoprotein large subunit [Budvicia aquatica]|uniref:Electron transfer flavoprotein large subunit n=1 Tax=Budvicia aquatica TaxID=82979 RepID=A0A484ZKV1_9GAMM|nr:Electron transfer flavoprotein large subunit [Budvicia aquatica]
MENPSLLLMSATKRSKALAARLSVKLQAGLINDAAEICLNNGQVQAKHRVYGGLAFSEARMTSGLAIVTLVAGAFDALPADENRSGSITNVSFVMPESPLVFVERKPKQGSNVDLSKARRVVGIGRGLTAEADLKMVEELADLLDAELGCSRPIAEGEHWMERERYIGVSGVMLKSDIYLALGISGQIQHMVGANAARTIVAINKDKNAPIFQYADYGLVGDIYKAIPALITQLKG